MTRYIIRRVLYAFPILIGVALLTFILFYKVIPPAEMARRQLGKNPTQAQIQGWLQQRGYDRPMPEQFARHVKELFLFQFGRTDATNELIWDKLKQGAVPSLQISGTVFVAGLITAILFSLFVAYYRGTYVDHAGTFISVLIMSIVYIVWIVWGQYLFGKVLKYSPLAGYRDGMVSWKFILLPTLIGVISGLGASVRFYRTVMLDEINQDYVRTARAKGVDERGVLFKHVLKNAMIPIITSTAAAIPTLILGNLLLESFFGIPGLGGVTVDAINSQDFALVRAVVFLGAVLYIVGLILTDICYALVDPRIRLE